MALAVLPAHVNPAGRPGVNASIKYALYQLVAWKNYPALFRVAYHFARSFDLSISAVPLFSSCATFDVRQRTRLWRRFTAYEGDPLKTKILGSGASTISV